MKNNIAVNGGWRLWRGQQTLKSKSLEKKFAAELVKAGPDERREIYQRMAEEALRRNKMLNHKPSAGTL